MAVSTDSGTYEVQFPDNDSLPHIGPVYRLLARVSKWSMEYADYHYEHCDWRRIAV